MLPRYAQFKEECHAKHVSGVALCEQMWAMQKNFKVSVNQRVGDSVLKGVVRKKLCPLISDHPMRSHIFGTSILPEAST
jgi:hypothetical protein